MMPLMLMTAVSTALFYLGSRALITHWLWSRYPPALASLFECPACVGFWWGVVLALTLFRHSQLSVLGLDPSVWWTVPITGLVCLFTTSIGTGLMQWGLDHTGTVASEEPEP